MVEISYLDGNELHRHNRVQNEMGQGGDNRSTAMNAPNIR